MATNYPLATLAAQVTSAGISAPSYAEVLASLEASFKQIYGNDVYIAPDSQDGEFLALLAQAISDSNQAAIAVYQSFSPVYAQGVGLSNMVKINGLTRQNATNSTAVGTVGGTAGTPITNGQVKDENGNLWDLPVSVNIPSSGSISVTVTAVNSGAIVAPIGTITKIATPTRGWQTFTNTSAAAPGADVESDATLRQRQAVSTAGSAEAIIDAIRAEVANITGVTRTKVYENDTNTTDANGIPARNISAVVEGGSTVDIATAIQLKKPPGIPTYGTTSYTVTDNVGLPIAINWFVLADKQVYVTVGITALTGYLSTTGDQIVAALVEYLSALDIGEDVQYMRLISVANLTGTAALKASGLTQAQLDALSATYELTSLEVGFSASPTGTADLTVAFNEAAMSQSSNIVVNVA